MNRLARGGATGRWLAGVAAAALVAALLATFVSSGFGSAPSVAWIAYVRHNDVYVVDPATGETQRLTEGHAVPSPAGFIGDVSVSLDGTEVAYTARAAGKVPDRHATTIDVRAVTGGPPRDVTPWKSAGYAGPPQAVRRHIDPHWLDSTHLDYTDDLQSNGQSWGIAMTVDLTNGRHGHARVPRAVRRQILEPFVAAGPNTAYSVLFPRASDCASTRDLARAAGSTQVRLSHTPLKNEKPLDIDAAGDVLGIRFWVAAGPHDGLCTFGTSWLTYELVVFGGDGTTPVLQRFARIKQVPLSNPPNFDAAWSPDGQQIAYTDPAGDLMVMTPGGASQELVAGGVEALDW
jgi:hypothetical protein